MMTGEFSFAAVSITAFIEFEPMQFAAGRANPLALARAKISWTSGAGDDAGREVVARFGHEAIVVTSLR